MSATERIVVIGAGPAGLATAGALARRGLACTVLERESRLAPSWDRRYDSLRLHTARRLSGLPGLPIPRRNGRWVSRDGFRDYLRAYAEKFEIRPEFGTEVSGLSPEEGGWSLQTSTGQVCASVVVVATGLNGSPWIPAWPGRDTFPGSLIHSAEYRRPDEYRGLDVLVVGSGNSGSEIATEVARVAKTVRLAVRTPPNIVPRSSLGVPSQAIGIGLKAVPDALTGPVTAALRRATIPDLTAYGLPGPGRNGYRQFQRSHTIPILDHGFVDMVRDGRIVPVAAVDSFEGAVVQLTDGRTLTPDAVVAATGYSPGLEALVGALGVLDATGVPRVRGGRTVPEAPGLHFVGVTVALSGLLFEISREARSAARVIARAARHT